MCTAYQIQYLDCGDLGVIMYDNCATYTSTGSCDERAKIEANKSLVKVKAVNASCGSHQ
jgi:hypothetical protein